MIVSNEASLLNPTASAFVKKRREAGSARTTCAVANYGFS